MKKIYSLFAAVVLAATVNAQITDTYSFTGLKDGVLSVENTTDKVEFTFSVNKGKSTANNPAFFDVNGDTPSHVRLYSVRASGEGNILTIMPISGKIIENVIFSVLTDTPDVTYVVGSGKVQNAIRLDKENTYTLVNETSEIGALVLKNAHKGGDKNLQLRIAEITITYKDDSGLDVGDVTKAKVNLVKNTVVSSELIFGATAKVSIYNMAGQVVKTAEVVDGAKLNISALPKGTYIVSGTVNGQAVSQKIVKQ